MSEVAQFSVSLDTQRAALLLIELEESFLGAPERRWR
jgi:hypothetical protein